MKLWDESRLQFEGAQTEADWIDECSAQILCAALSYGIPLLIILPDEAPHRVPMLFATLLVMRTLDSRRYGIRAKEDVIYFGTTAGIRKYLTQIHVRGTSLSEVFSQINLKRDGTRRHGGTTKRSISNVVFSYAPVGPEEAMSRYNPAWVFLDCGVGENVRWVSPALHAIKESKTPSVGCIQNPLSSAIKDFEDAGWHIYRWPYSTFETLLGLKPSGVTQITPIVLQNGTILEQSEKYGEVYRRMFRVSQVLEGRFAQDMQRAIWNYIRALERLVTPYAFYEAEYGDYWGIYSLKRYKDTAEKFIEALWEDDSSTQNDLPVVKMLLDDIYQQLTQIDPPLWAGLCELCVEDSLDDQARVIVFPSQARRDLFSHALLSYHNISTPELSEINVWLVSLKQFARWQRERESLHTHGYNSGDEIPKRFLQQDWRPLLIGTPFSHIYPRCATLLRYREVDILIYPHQYNALRRHYDQWANAVSLDKRQLHSILSILQGNATLWVASTELQQVEARLHLRPMKVLEIGSTPQRVQTKLEEIFQASPHVDEIAWLMQMEDTEHPEDIGSSPMSDESGQPPAEEPMTVEQALCVVFKQGYEALFLPRQTIQVIVKSDGGPALDERVVRSLRPGDEVLFIHGQRRQSLYDLTVSRIHAHPSFLPHLNLVERWQDELREKFRESGLTVEEVLRRMQEKGSDLQTPQAIRFWLYKDVLCPRDGKDLMRLAEVLDMPFVKEYHRQIVQAARRLRGLHIKVARGLNRWLREEAIGASQNELEKMIDPELGLKLRDFQDALLRLTVAESYLIKGLFLVSELGELERKD